MPFDYNEFSQGVQKAREAKVNDNDILSHLASLDQGFKDAKENGYTLEEVDNFLKEKYKTQGGDKNAYQTSQSSDGSSQESNAQGGQAVPIQAGSSEGVQPNEQPGSKDQQVVQRGQQANLNIKTALTGDSQFGIGGEPLEKQEQMSVGSGYTGPQAQIQQAIPTQEEAGSMIIRHTTFDIVVGMILLLALSKFIARVQFSLSTSFWCSCIGHIVGCVGALIAGFLFVKYLGAASLVVVAIEWFFMTGLFQIAVRAKGGTLQQWRAAILALIVILGDLFVASPLIELWEHLH